MPRSRDIGVLLIRIFTAATFFYYQLVDQLSLARLFVWEKAEWNLATQVKALGLPFPGTISCLFILLLTIALLALVFGFFTRINALVLVLFTSAILIVPLNLSLFLTPQALVLYLGIFVGLAWGGAGRASLDYRLSARKRSKKRDS